MNRLGEGDRFGRLTFVELMGSQGAGKPRLGLWRCDCGATKEVAVTRVKNGYTQSCGCLMVERLRAATVKHGMRDSGEYSSWLAMKDRCLNPNSKDFPQWGGRGITICREWIESFEAFYRDMGPRPDGATLDRIDNREGYEPANCRWATRQEQQRNRASSYQWHIKGETFETHTEAAMRFGVSGHTIWRWVNGQFDKRRNRFTDALEGCYVTPRY